MPILNVDDKKAVKKIQTFLSKDSNTTFMQTLEWGKVKSNWDQEVVYVEEKGKIKACMMILIMKIKYLNKTIMYAPRGPICDINDIETVNLLVKEAEPLKKKYNSIFLKMDPEVLYSSELVNLYTKSGYKVTKDNACSDDLIQPQYNMVLNIKKEKEEDLLSRFKSKTRYNIKLAEKKGVTVRYSRDEEDLKKFYEIYKVTTERDRISTRDYDYFKRMLDAYDESHLRIYLAEYEGEALSGAIAVNYGTELFYVYGASSNEKRNYMPNYKMQWEMIKWGLELKCETYNFGGVLNLEETNGLYKFKIGFCNKEGVTKYIGEIDKVYDKFLYFAYVKCLPMLKKVKRKLSR